MSDLNSATVTHTLPTNYFKKFREVGSYLPSAQKCARYIQDSYNYFSNLSLSQKILTGSAVFLGMRWIRSYFNKTQETIQKSSSFNIPTNEAKDIKRENSSTLSSESSGGTHTTRKRVSGRESLQMHRRNCSQFSDTLRIKAQ